MQGWSRHEGGAGWTRPTTGTTVVAAAMPTRERLAESSDFEFEPVFEDTTGYEEVVEQLPGRREAVIAAVAAAAAEAWVNVAAAADACRVIAAAWGCAGSKVAATAQHSGGTNSLVESTNAFSKVLTTLGTEAVSRTEAVGKPIVISKSSIGKRKLMPNNGSLSNNNSYHNQKTTGSMHAYLANNKTRPHPMKKR